MSNPISRLFLNPAEGNDQKAVDLLELHVNPYKVQNIRDAHSHDEACSLVNELFEALDDSPLEKKQVAWLKEWIGLVILMPRDDVRPQVNFA
jgi:hypothetical protein